MGSSTYPPPIANLSVLLVRVSLWEHSDGSNGLSLDDDGKNLGWNDGNDTSRTFNGVIPVYGNGTWFNHFETLKLFAYFATLSASEIWNSRRSNPIQTQHRVTACALFGGHRGRMRMPERQRAL
jgi:hypothetical protein